MASSITSILQPHLKHFMQSRTHPSTFCPSEVVRALSEEELRQCGATSWRELMPAVRDLAVEQRAQGNLEILQKRVVLDDDALKNVVGPIRLRAVTSQTFHNQVGQRR